MATSFDTAAAAYDDTFTHSVIGKLQRGYVYNHLTKILKDAKPQNILEINCGTGTDAVWMAKQGYNVTATDVSPKMIEIAKNKSDSGNLTFLEVDINELPHHFKSEKFDFIFSNFGGLNCLSEIQLELFFKNTSQLLSENGQLVLVIMPKNTLWEQFYFLSKANFKNVFRRKRGSLIANVDGENVITYYYNPKETVQLAAYYFDYRKSYPIGFFIPPSYLEPVFKNRFRLTSFLDTLESKVNQRKLLSKYADHYLIVFQKK
jgi:ubiquinone/menaquinone biosynthesis C-methylase UbiE